MPLCFVCCHLLSLAVLYSQLLSIAANCRHLPSSSVRLHHGCYLFVSVCCDVFGLPSFAVHCRHFLLRLHQCRLASILLCHVTRMLGLDDLLLWCVVLYAHVILRCHYASVVAGLLHCLVRLPFCESGGRTQTLFGTMVWVTCLDTCVPS